MTESAAEVDPVREAVKAGIQDAISDPETWARIRKGMTDYARSEAGTFTLGIFGTFARWVARGAFVFLLLWYFGGLPAVLAWVKGGANH